MDDLALHTNLPVVASLTRCVVTFGDNVGRCGVNMNCKRTILGDLDSTDLVMCMLCNCCPNCSEVSLGQLRGPREWRPALGSGLWRHNVCPATLAHDLPCAVDAPNEILTASRRTGCSLHTRAVGLRRLSNDDDVIVRGCANSCCDATDIFLRDFAFDARLC